MRKLSTSEKIFTVCNTIFMIFVIFITLYPFYYIICASLSDNTAFMQHQGVVLAPIGFTTGAYDMTFRYPLVSSGYKNTLIILICGLPLNLIMTLLCAYCLAAKGLMFKKFIIFVTMFTMYFGGGLIPSFLNVRELGMYNSLAAVIIPGCLSVYNSIIVKTSIESIPDSLSESAKLDGANDIYLLFRIIVPLILPTLAVIMLYYAVGHWNSWFSAAIYISDNTKMPIQAVLRAILIENNELLNSTQVSQEGEANRFAETIKYSLIVVGTVPILMVYPFAQRYFIKGVMIGAVKG